MENGISCLPHCSDSSVKIGFNWDRSTQQPTLNVQWRKYCMLSSTEGEPNVWTVVTWHYRRRGHLIWHENKILCDSSRGLIEDGPWPLQSHCPVELTLTADHALHETKQWSPKISPHFCLTCAWLLFPVDHFCVASPELIFHLVGCYWFPICYEIYMNNG